MFEDGQSFLHHLQHPDDGKKPVEKVEYEMISFLCCNRSFCLIAFQHFPWPSVAPHEIQSGHSTHPYRRDIPTKLRIDTIKPHLIRY